MRPSFRPWQALLLFAALLILPGLVPGGVRPGGLRRGGRPEAEDTDGHREAEQASAHGQPSEKVLERER